MPPFPSKDDALKPIRRVGVWSNEATKQKNNAPEKVIKHISNDCSINEDDDITSTKNKNTFNEVAKIQLKSNLYKLPALNSLNINIGLFLNQFNEEDQVKEEDTIWTRDSLFTEIMNNVKT